MSSEFPTSFQTIYSINYVQIYMELTDKYVVVLPLNEDKFYDLRYCHGYLYGYYWPRLVTIFF